MSLMITSDLKALQYAYLHPDVSNSPKKQISIIIEINYIGIEKYSTVLLRAVQKMEAQELCNLRLVRMEAEEICEVFGRARWGGST